VVSLAGLVALVAGAVGVWELSNSRTYQVAGVLVARVDTTEPVVALTFDDGPVSERIEPLLVLLRDADVRATFYVIGEQLAQRPESGRRLVAAGHELGNHSYTHQRMVFRSSDFYVREIEETDAQIRAVGQQGPIHFRPPFGKKLIGLPLYLAQTDRISVTWDVEPDTGSSGASADQLVAKTLAEARAGSIILLHPWYDGGEQTRQAIRPIIAGLRERGYRFVTVSELLALRR
jgi:peptidoglycan-N-acetylglucosamine deacetylase